MKLTVKDKDFLERLKSLLEAKELSIGLKEDGYKRLVLRQNYGDKVEKTFNMSRQGVRWRFYRLFNEVYVFAYETIYFVESFFGTELRQMAMEIAKERVELSEGLRRALLNQGRFLDDPHVLYEHERACRRGDVVHALRCQSRLADHFLQILFALIVLNTDRRRVVHFNVTDSPSGASTGQQRHDPLTYEPTSETRLRPDSSTTDQGRSLQHCYLSSQLARSVIVEWTFEA